MKGILYVRTVWEKLRYKHCVVKRPLANSFFAGEAKFDRSARQIMLALKTPDHIQKRALLILSTHYLWVPCHSDSSLLEICLMSHVELRRWPLGVLSHPPIDGSPLPYFPRFWCIGVWCVWWLRHWTLELDFMTSNPVFTTWYQENGKVTRTL